MSAKMPFMKCLLALVSLLVLSGITTSQGADLRAHLAARPADFRCDLVQTGGQGSMTSRMYYSSGGLKRVETQRGGMNLAMIVRPDRQKMLMIIHERKQIMDMPYDAAKAQDEMELLNKDAQANIEAQGAEMVRDVLCDKFVVISSRGVKSSLWISQADHTVRRVVSNADTVTSEFINYQIGPQGADLFEPPAGYQMMALPGGAPGAPPAK